MRSFMFLLLLFSCTLLGTACDPKTDEDESSAGNKSLWPSGWQIHDEHLEDSSFVNSNELTAENCGDNCYWTGIMECPSEEINHVSAGFEAGVDCDFAFYGGEFGEPDVVPLDNGNVLLKHSERTLFELTLDGTPGRQVGLAPDDFMQDQEGVRSASIFYHEIERTPSGRIFALAIASLQTNTSNYDAYVVVELEGAELEPRLIAQINFERSLSNETIQNFLVSEELDVALALRTSGVSSRQLHQIDLTTGAIEDIESTAHRYDINSMLATSGRAYTTALKDGDADIFLIEVDIETGVEAEVPFPEISEEDWYYVGNRHLVQNTFSAHNGYITYQSKADGTARHLWIGSDGASAPLDDYNDPHIVFDSAPFFMGNTLYGLGTYNDGLYKRTALWFYEDAPRL